MADEDKPESLFPEHDKLHAIKDQSQRIGDFLEWLSSRGYVICTWDEHDWPRPEHRRIEEWLADYFQIDLKRLEEEKLAMLWSIRRGLKIE
jgi:predicted Rossmann fold nucleotide-binding protein DprA/Smf involved in DNA uptake